MSAHTSEQRKAQQAEQIFSALLRARRCRHWLTIAALALVNAVLLTILLKLWGVL